MKQKGFSTEVTPLYVCGDRFLPTGYREEKFKGLEDKIKAITSIEDIVAVELCYPAQFDDPKPMKEILDRLGITASIVMIDLFGHKKWGYGSLCSSDQNLRREAVELSQKGIDAACALGCDRVALWLGQDGFDYPMQVNYQEYWENTISAIKDIAGYRSDIKLCLEYKPKEPRTHSQLSTAGVTLAVIDAVGLENVGIILDLGHSFYSYENPAEQAVLINRSHRLFHVHLNDNYRYWDDDLIVGSVHLWETLEFLYWLHRIGYQGWYSLDIFPYREDGLEATEASLANLKALMKIAESLDQEKLDALQRKNDAVAVVNMLRNLVLRKT